MHDKDDLLEAFHRFQQALLSNDVEELDRLLAQDYRGYSLRGELEAREAVLEAWKPGGITMDEFDYEELFADVRGNVGILTGNGFVGGSSQGARWQHHLHFCDLYEKTPEGWKIFLSHSVEIGSDATSPVPSEDESTG